MNDESLRALEAEVERQDAMFEDAKSALLALGDVEIDVSAVLLDELDALAAQKNLNCVTLLNSVRA
jgi:hypothetical protein